MTKPCLPGLFAEPESTFRDKKAVNVPRTSVLAYQERGRAGRVGDALTFIQQVVAKTHQAPTSAEVAEDYNSHSPTPGFTRPYSVLHIRRGLSDALAAGLVEHAPARKCTVSGRTCVAWRLRQR